MGERELVLDETGKIDSFFYNDQSINRNFNNISYMKIILERIKYLYNTIICKANNSTFLFKLIINFRLTTIQVER